MTQLTNDEIRTIHVVDELPSADEPALLVTIPDHAKAVVCRFLTKSLDSYKLLATSHPEVWFECPLPLVHRSVGYDTVRCVLLNQEILTDPNCPYRFELGIQ